VRDWTDGPATVLLGDALERLRELPDESVDAVVTDPPAGISFMGAAWDTFPTRQRPAGHTVGDGRSRPGIAGGQEYRRGMREPFIAFMTAAMAECLRVLKPGAHGLVWALPRTSHWTATALEDAGFEVRDIVHHHFGSGFPKSLDVGRSIDEALCPQPDRHYWSEPSLPKGDKARPGDHVCAFTVEGDQHRADGTALKPAAEHWILVRKPLDRPNVAANVLEHGTGALNIDGCRVGIGAGGGRDGEASAERRYAEGSSDFAMLPGPRGGDVRGRWPANLVLSHAEGCVPVGTRRVRGTNVPSATVHDSMGYQKGWAGRAPNHHADGDGLETVEAWECVTDGSCPVAELDLQSGVRVSGSRSAGVRTGLGYHGANGASRFFYVAKASARERSAGLPLGERNTHPTVKPIELMRWLCRLVTPPGGVVLDPFMGSGTTGCAAALEGFRFIGIEQDEESVRTAIARIEHWRRRPNVERPARRAEPAPGQATLPLLELEAR
jgi:DNA modification methylase